MNLFEKHRLIYLFRRYFVSGLLIWVPVLVTIIVIKFVVNLLDQWLLWLPTDYQPDNFFHIVYSDIIITLLLILLTGVVVTNIVGKKIVRYLDRFISHIPVVNAIYHGVKRILKSLFNPESHLFDKVLLVEFPCAGTWTLAFETAQAAPEINDTLKEKNMMTLFVLLAPNFTCGFLMLVSRKKVIELNMSMDQALKYVISLGILPTS